MRLQFSKYMDTSLEVFLHRFGWGLYSRVYGSVRIHCNRDSIPNDSLLQNSVHFQNLVSPEPSIFFYSGCFHRILHKILHNIGHGGPTIQQSFPQNCTV